ncbi:hypothetical protein HZA57_06645, partial [Candidatus Poribacteria bacterium]|nr:hypothetical protein [Candidatus Poribacteria bacterium]
EETRERAADQELAACGEPGPERRAASREGPLESGKGRADETFAFYRDVVGSYLAANYRTLEGREHRATCGSSLGGLFSAYIAWEHPEFARQHAAISPSFWATRNALGGLEAVERFRTGARRDIRLWLDSGTLSTPATGDDGMWDTFQARDALIHNGYRMGRDLWHYLDFGGTHNEAAWSRRLFRIFRFLFPVQQAKP